MTPVTHSIRLEIPTAYQSLNRTLRKHWGARYRDDSCVRLLVRAQAMRLRRAWPRSPELPVDVTVCRYGARKLDGDNLAGGAYPSSTNSSRAECSPMTRPRMCASRTRSALTGRTEEPSSR